MVLVRRKSDGLYCTNKTGSRAFYRRQHWSANPADCKPYASVSGAMNSFRHYIPYEKCDCPARSKPYYSAKHTSKCFRVVESKRKFDAEYEVVPINVTVSVK